ncbi:MAG TPA: hydrogenase iron-sulfur subunit [Atribacter sp.]|uniref:hydrogenase iron-sulfur subunit n=1 Tax=Atribacter sp. TaxID=2847780 RepID=UPI00175CBDFF|nr:hydrogenase iron-sulfur subunit [Atribacter sp.]MDI9594734.1 hydrogenase iron-sulfur subunit [Atribacterota bacterium]HHT08943.1 hydrogenase iron-sulfur subunit [Candidatus Atribacteria bacterium]HOT05737.1 hydrogenase iron-sulfur subunit [Atribacter sp.]HQK82631.1 hydrogenase iron-sulfur subunit [Atribacter sp.]
MKILVIACDKSGYPAMIKYTTENSTNHEFIKIIKAPCLGSVKESDILEALEGKCDRILLVGCPIDSCFHQNGSRFAQRRVNRINHLLEEAGITKRVAISFVTAEKISEIKRTLDLISSTPVQEEHKP